MMTNLFSIFDPSSSMTGLSMNWGVTGLSCLLFSFSFWKIPSRFTYLWGKLLLVLTKELSPVLGNKNVSLTIILSSLFFFIFFNNVVSLFPYIFTAPSHLSFTLSLSLPLWAGYFVFSWKSSMKEMFAHLVPLGTPFMLVPLMVLIETVSMLIRPLTLAIRLAANLIAGHLLLALLSGAVSIFNPVSFILIIIVQTLLMLLEVAVAIIQAYVFTVLMALYVSEV